MTNVLGKVIGAALILGGIALGVYVGLVLMFVGGVKEIVDGVQAHPVDGGAIGWGAVRILDATTVGGITAALCMLLGAFFWGDE